MKRSTLAVMLFCTMAFLHVEASVKPPGQSTKNEQVEVGVIAPATAEVRIESYSGLLYASRPTTRLCNLCGYTEMQLCTGTAPVSATEFKPCGITEVSSVVLHPLRIALC